jgi:hypothetical protein
MFLAHRSNSFWRFRAIAKSSSGAAGGKKSSGIFCGGGASVILHLM